MGPKRPNILIKRSIIITFPPEFDNLARNCTLSVSSANGKESVFADSAVTAETAHLTIPRNFAIFIGVNFKDEILRLRSE